MSESKLKLYFVDKNWQSMVVEGELMLHFNKSSAPSSSNSLQFLSNLRGVKQKLLCNYFISEIIYNIDYKLLHKHHIST
jgi:hypothetical protein